MKIIIKSLVLLACAASLLSCDGSMPGGWKVAEVKNKDGSTSKVLCSDVYPYSDFVAQYPGSKVRTCVRPIDHPEILPFVLLDFAPQAGASPEYWYKEKLEQGGWKVDVASLAGTTMLRATKNEDQLGISIFGEAGGVIEIRAARNGATIPASESSVSSETSSRAGADTTADSEAFVDVNSIADKVAAAVQENGLYENATLSVLRRDLMAKNRLANHKDEFRNALQSRFDQQGGKYKTATSDVYDLKIFEDSDSSAVFIKGRRLEVKSKD